MARPKVSDLLAQEEATGAPAASVRPKVADLASKEAADPGFWSKALEYGLKPIAFVGEQIDRVSGAPLRAGISAAQDVAESDTDLPTWRQAPEGLAAFGKAALGQFGRDPSKAPTSKSLFERAGLSGEGSDAQISGSPIPSLPGFGASYAGSDGKGISPAGAAGFALDALTPLPGAGQVGAAMKMAGKGAAPVAKMAAKGAAAAVDVATGTKLASKTVGGVKGAIKALGDSFDSAKEGLKATFGAKQADDFAESVKTAMANGIDPKLLPEAVEFGPNSIITRTARVQAEGPLGQPLLEKFTKAQDEVRGAIKRDVEKIAGGPPMSRRQAGEALQEGFNAGVQQAFDGIEAGHKAILQQVPDLVLTRGQMDNLLPKLVDLEGWAKGKVSSGVTNTAKGQGRQILRAVENVKQKLASSTGPGEVVQAPYAGVYQALKEIGDVAFKKSPNSLADVPPDIARFRKLYGDLNDALIGTVEESMDAGAAKAIRDANSAFSKIYGDKGLLGRLGEKTASGEDLFSEVIQHGSSKEIEALKGYLKPEQLQALKGAFLDDMIKLDPEGKFTFRSTFNRLRDKEEVAAALFEPGELDNFLGLVKLGDKFGSAVMSTSGTGASGAFGEFLKTSKNRLIDDPIAANRKTKARAIGFNIEEMAPGKLAAKKPGPGPIMSLAPRFIREDLPKFNPRARAARAFSLYDEEDEDQ